MKNVFGLLNISSKFRVICVINGLENVQGSVAYVLINGQS